MSKVCRICGVEKPDGKFSINRSTSDGHDTICKPCKAHIDKEKYQKARRNGLCASCGEPAMPERSRCMNCWFKYTARQSGDDEGVLKDKWTGVCQFTGEPLFPCENASWRGVWVSRKMAAIIDAVGMDGLEEVAERIIDRL